MWKGALKGPGRPFLKPVRPAPRTALTAAQHTGVNLKRDDKDAGAFFLARRRPSV